MLEVAKKKKLYRCYTCSYLENGVLTDRNGKYTNYCNFVRQNVIPSLCEEVEDTKGLTRKFVKRRTTHHNGQKKKDKRTNNDLQNITHKN